MKKLFLAATFAALLVVLCAVSVSAAGMSVIYDGTTNHPEQCTDSSYVLDKIKVYDDIDIIYRPLTQLNNFKWSSAAELWLTNVDTKWAYTVEIVNAKTGSKIITVRLYPGMTWHKTLADLGCSDFVIRHSETVLPYQIDTSTPSGTYPMTSTVTQRVKIPGQDGYNTIATTTTAAGKWIEITWADYEGYTAVTKTQRVWVSGSGTLMQTYTEETKYATVTVYFCRPDGTRVYTARVKHLPGEQITIDTQQLLDDSYLFPDRLTAPASISTSATTSESKTVYMVDVGSSYDSGYAAGKREKEKEWQSKVSGIKYDSYQSGYADGYNIGISQNELTGEQIKNVKADYNLVTGFFDGIWEGARSAYNTLSSISVAGVNLNTIIFLAVVAVILVLVAKVFVK